MKNLLISTLASFILFQGMFVYLDVSFEINEILEDYQLHKTKYGDNISSFLSKHYGDLKESHKEQHKKEHQQHKHHDNLEINNSVDYVFSCYHIEINPNIEINNRTTNFYYKDLFSTFEKQKIFQPPRFS